MEQKLCILSLYSVTKAIGRDNTPTLSVTLYTLSFFTDVAARSGICQRLSLFFVAGIRVSVSQDCKALSGNVRWHNVSAHTLHDRRESNGQVRSDSHGLTMALHFFPVLVELYETLPTRHMCLNEHNNCIYTANQNKGSICPVFQTSVKQDATKRVS